MFVSESRYKRQTHVIQTDFTEGHSIYSAIAQQLEGLQIGILGKIKIKCKTVKMVQKNEMNFDQPYRGHRINVFHF